MARMRFQAGLRGATLAYLMAFMMACAGGQSSMPLPVPDVELSLEPQSVSMAPGTSMQILLTARSLVGFSGPVELSVDPQGSGLEASVSPTILTIGPGEGRAVVSVRVPETATAGDRLLRVHTQGTFGQHDFPFKVAVLQAHLLPVSTFLNYTQANLNLMAFKDGDKPWRSLEGRDGAYLAAVTDPAGRYGLAYGYTCILGTFRSFQMNYIFQTLKESSSLTVYFICDPPPGPNPILYSLKGQIGGLGPQSGHLVTSAAALSFQGGVNSYLTQVLKGKGDLAGWTYLDAATELPTRFFLDRGRDAQGDAVRNVDFSSEGFDPGPAQSVSYGPVGGDETIRGIVRYFTAGGQYLDLANGTAPAAYAAFPAERSLPGDSYGYAFGASGTGHSETVYGGSKGVPGALSIGFPTIVPPIQVDWLKDGTLRPALTWFSVSPEPQLQQFSLSQGLSEAQVYWYLLFSAGWLGGGTHSVQLPALANLAGWEEGWAFRVGRPVNLDHGQFGSIGGGSTDGAMPPTFQPLSSLAPQLRLRSTAGQQQGGFRVVGLVSTPSLNSFSATRQSVTTP